MSLADIAAKLRRGTKENSPLLLAVGASVGVVATAYLTAKAAVKAHTLILLEEPELTELETREKIALTWKFYIPSALVGATTIAAIVGVKHTAATKTLAAQTALAVTQKAYENYRGKVIEEFGEKKDQALQAKVAEDRVNANPPSTIIAGSGTALCCELHTGRYFNSDMQTLHRIVNEINAKMLRHDYATLDDFYYELGLEMTKTSGQTGWTSDKLLELEFSAVLHNGNPCLAFDYNYIKGL